MINLCLFIFTAYILRKILLMISPKLVFWLEEKAQLLLIYAVSLIMFIAEISAPTKTERQIYSNTKAAAKKYFKKKRQALLKSRAFISAKRTAVLFEPVTIERRNLYSERTCNLKDNNKAA